MTQISPTRSSLLELKKKIVLAKKGHNLLKKKQDFLIGEFFKLIKDYSKSKGNLNSKTKSVYNTLVLDIAYSGIFVSKAVSYATKPNFTLESSTKNMMGVKIPEIQVEKKKNEFNTYENSPLLAQARSEFQDLLSQIISLSSKEQAIRILGDEIKKIKRRVNSLENIQIPKLQKFHDEIQFVLSEQERENFTRLKIIKEKLSA